MAAPLTGWNTTPALIGRYSATAPSTSIVTLHPLAHHPRLIPLIVQLLHMDWGHLSPWSDTGQIEQRLRAASSSPGFPRAFVAVTDEGDFMGTVSLKLWELPQPRERKHWLGELYVHPHFRRRGVATELVRLAVRHAMEHGAPCLYLYTPDQQHVYARMGWHDVEKRVVNGEQAHIMALPLGGCAH